MSIDQFIAKNKSFWWYVKDPAKLDDQAVVEGVIKYGDMPEIRQLMQIIGPRKVARIFSSQIAGRRPNYDPQTIAYFKRYFKQYAK